MVENARRADLAQKAALKHFLFTLGRVRVQTDQFDRDLAANGRVFRLHHPAHASAAEFFQDLISSDLLQLCHVTFCG